MSNPRVNVYVDGFNFYFGLKSNRWRKYYWLDLVKLFSQFIKPHQNLERVYYFSARPHDMGKSSRQDLFFSANKINSKFHLHLGKYLKKPIKCNSCGSEIVRYEEKETDVRIATLIIRDVVLDKCDISIIVSADSDLIPSIELIRELKPNHKVFVYFPPKRFSFDLDSKSNGSIKLEHHESKFKNAILPNEIEMTNGFKLVKPKHWT